MREASCSVSLLLGGTSDAGGDGTAVKVLDAKVGGQNGHEQREGKDDEGLVNVATGNDGARHGQLHGVGLDSALRAVLLGKRKRCRGQRELGSAVLKRKLVVHHTHHVVVVVKVLARLRDVQDLVSKREKKLRHARALTLGPETDSWPDTTSRNSGSVSLIFTSVARPPLPFLYDTRIVYRPLRSDTNSFLATMLCDEATLHKRAVSGRL